MTSAENAYLVVSTVGGTNVYYIGSFTDEASAEAHAAEHNAQPDTSAVVQTLVNPLNC